MAAENCKISKWHLISEIYYWRSKQPVHTSKRRFFDSNLSGFLSKPGHDSPFHLIQFFSCVITVVMVLEKRRPIGPIASNVFITFVRVATTQVSFSCKPLLVSPRWVQKAHCLPVLLLAYVETALTCSLLQTLNHRWQEGDWDLAIAETERWSKSVQEFGDGRLDPLTRKNTFVSGMWKD
jgi:hypothetical protein